MDKLRIIGARAGQLLPFLLPEIGERNRAGRRVLLLVPEQYTLQAERELIEGLDLPGMLDLEVLSPRRLNTRIADRGGASPLPPLDDRGRSMALSQALRTVQEQLTYYRRVAEQPSLPQRISVLLSDMEKAGMEPDSLLVYASAQAGAAKAKLTDLALIWRTYLALIDGRFADQLAQQRDMTARVVPSGVLTGADVYVYGFDVLQAPLIDLLCAAMPVAASMTVSLVMDRPEANDARIFHTQRSTARHLIDALEQHGLPWSLRYLEPKADLTRDPALRHLEQHLFTRLNTVYEPDTQSIAVHAAANPYAEAAYVAQTLRRWHEAGIPWQKMAVALCEGNTLPGVLAVTLKAANIPHYVARKDSAVRHGLCRMLIGALRAVVGGYSVTDVLSCAKSGFSTLTDEEAMHLENYAIENGIDRGKWQRTFTRGSNAESMNQLRERLMNPLVLLHDRLRYARTSAQSVEAVFQLLVDMNAYDRLMARETELLQRGMQAEAAQNRQVWQIVMGLLDQLHALLGETRAVMKDMAGFIEAGLTGAAISALPPAPDCVMVGEAGHLMTGALDALLLMGVQDGVTAAGMDSLITEQERAALTEHNRRPVGMTRQEQNALRQSDFYRTLALPARFLTLTFSEGGQDGTALRPAGMIGDILTMFPSVKMTGGVTADGSSDAPLSPLTALDGLSLRLRTMLDKGDTSLDPAWQEALRWLWHEPAWHDRTRVMLESLNARVEAGTLTLDQTRRLFTQDTVSISRLEEFAECPYRHFVDYGLKPVERRAFEFDAGDKGSFFHAAMQDYATLAASMPNWPNVDDDAIDRMVEQVVAPLTESWTGGPLREDAMGRALGEEYIRSVRRSAWMFTKHARNSRFTTIGAEVRFGGEDGLPPVILELHDGRRIALRGVIDRIDRYEGDKGLYLRVVDYKSSSHALEPVRMWYGLQLQLLLYLKAAEQSQPGAMPAGAFYFRINNPTVTAADVKEQAEAKIAQAMRLKGVVLAETEVVEAMDADLPEYSLGKVFTKDGSVSASANAYDLNGMHGLLEHARRTAASLADRIREGCIDISPAQIENWTACDWCAYAGICGIDPALPGGEKRRLVCEDKKELLERMANEYNMDPQIGASQNKGLHPAEK